MFKTHPDGMLPEPTPERVLAVCNMAAKQPMEKEEMQRLLTMNWKADTDYSIVRASMEVAVDDLGLLQIKDGLICYRADPGIIASPTAFRRYISNKVFSIEDSTFTKFSKWIIALNERLFSLRRWEVMAKTCKEESVDIRNVGENDVLGWRFWAVFLGLGYLSGTMLIPNMKLRVQDILATSFSDRFQYGEAILAKDFIQWITPRLPEADLRDRLPLAMSAGLRTLHELGLIKLESWPDSVRVQLYRIDGDPVNDFSHITVYEEVRR